MTKEKFLLFLIAISMLVIAILPITVKATEVEEKKWTDFSNAKIEIIGESTAKNVSIEDATAITYKVKISNVTLNPEHVYSVYFHEKDESKKSGLGIKHSAQATLSNNEMEKTISLAEVFLQKSTDIYVTIAEGEANSTNPKIILEAKKIEHPELLPKLGNRLHIYFNLSSTNTFFWVPNCTKTGGSVDRTIKIKIGEVTNAEILKTIKESKAKGLQQLLNYAKKVKDYNYVGTIEYNHNGKPAITGITESLTSKMNLIDGVYYFAYIELDDENGVYYPVEDIALYRAKGTNDLVRYSDKDFTWEIEDKTQTENKPTEEEKSPEENKQEQNNKIENEATVSDNTQAVGKLPQTGEKIACMVGAIMLCVLTAIGYTKYRKYSDL